MTTPPDFPLQAAHELLELAEHASPAPWHLCPHLQEPPVDCPCGYEGNVSAGDDMLFEMGPHGNDADMISRPDDKTQRINAAFIVRARTLGPLIAQALVEAMERNRVLEAALRYISSHPVEVPIMERLSIGISGYPSCQAIARAAITRSEGQAALVKKAGSGMK